MERTDRQRVEDLEVKPYVIVSDLGKGSFATVYRGYHEVRPYHPVAACGSPMGDVLYSKHTSK